MHTRVPATPKPLKRVAAALSSSTISAVKERFCFILNHLQLPSLTVVVIRQCREAIWKNKNRRERRCWLTQLLAYSCNRVRFILYNVYFVELVFSE